MGVGSFCEYQYFYYEILFYLVSSYSPFFRYLKSKSTRILRHQKDNSGVKFNNTLLRFGFGSTSNYKEYKPCLMTMCV